MTPLLTPLRWVSYPSWGAFYGSKYYTILSLHVHAPLPSLFGLSFPLLSSSSTGLPEPRLDWNVFPWSYAFCTRGDASSWMLMMARALAGFPTRFVRPPAQSPSGGKKNWRFLNFSASSRYTVILLAARTQYTTRYPVSGGFLVKYDRTEVKQKRTHKTETELKKIVP